MIDLYALQIWEVCEHSHARILYTSDLYETREKTKMAILDLETREAFTAIWEIQQAENPLFQFEASDSSKSPFLIDDYAKAYFDGDPEIVHAVDSMCKWIGGEKTEWLTDCTLEFGYQNFTAHIET